MNKICTVGLILFIAGCTSKPDQHQNIDIANPASVNCVKQEGKLNIVRSDKGDVGYCTLPSGERVEEWVLYHRKKDK